MNTAVQAEVTRGHASTVRVFHENGADLDAELGETGMTAMQLACFRGRAKVVRVLAALSDVNAECWTEVAKLVGTPLHIAAFYGHADACEALVAAGHRVDARNFRSRTPLFAAATAGHVDALKVLIDAKANIASATYSLNATQSPLYIAARLGYLDVVHVLVANNCKVSDFPRPDDETGFAGVDNKCGEFIINIADYGGWQAYCAKLARDRPQPGVEKHSQLTGKLNLPKDFKTMS